MEGNSWDSYDELGTPPRPTLPGPLQPSFGVLLITNSIQQPSGFHGERTPRVGPGKGATPRLRIHEERPWQNNVWATAGGDADISGAAGEAADRAPPSAAWDARGGVQAAHHSGSAGAGAHLSVHGEAPLDAVRGQNRPKQSWPSERKGGEGKGEFKRL